MNKKATLSLVVLLLIGGVFIAKPGYFKPVKEWLAGSFSFYSSRLKPEPRKARPHYKPSGEADWVINSVGQDIAQILRFAKGDKKPVSGLEIETWETGTTLKYHLTASAHDSPRYEHDIELKHYIWAPENYTSWVRGLMATWGIAAPGTPQPENSKLPALLTNTFQETIIAESKRISAGLKTSPLDPELHEEAALVLGAFALKEAAGTFADVRQTLSRMSAHLAIAAASRPGGAYGKNGGIASLILLALAGREAEVVEVLAAHPLGLPAWENALKLRATHDWRILPNPASATLLEQVEYARALDFALGHLALVNFYKAKEIARIPDWVRIHLEKFFTVQEGHVLSETSMKQELDDLGINWKLFNGTKLTAEKMIDALNEPAAGSVQEGPGGPGIQVLSWGDFGAFHQRHIMQSCERTDYFLAHMWGVPENAAQFQSYVDKFFPRLTLYPVLKLRIANTPETYAAAITPAHNLWNDHPELVTGDNASFMSRERFKIRGITRMFLAIPILFGTTYDVENRFIKNEEINFMPYGWDESRKLNPYDIDILETWIWTKYRGDATPLQVDENFRLIIDYDLRAMRSVANRSKDNQEKYTSLMNRVCALDPNYYFQLGDYFRDKQMPQQAAEAYQRGFDHAPDRVRMSGNCVWLTNYYFDTGRKDQALKIAREAADVYSERGLETLAWLLERMGKWKEAEDYCQKIAVRYGSKADLIEFYIRNRSRDARYDREYKARLDKLFPKGLERDSIADFRGPPVDGAVVLEGTDLTSLYDIRPGAVFVSMDGYRVHTREQYFFIRALTMDPNVNLVVWTGSRYQEITANLPMRRFGCPLGDYQPKGPGHL